jgi:hypothetical protein
MASQCQLYRVRSGKRRNEERKKEGTNTNYALRVANPRVADRPAGGLLPEELISL